MYIIHIFVLINSNSIWTWIVMTKIMWIIIFHSVEWHCSFSSIMRPYTFTIPNSHGYRKRGENKRCIALAAIFSAEVDQLLLHMSSATFTYVTCGCIRACAVESCAYPDPMPHVLKSRKTDLCSTADRTLVLSGMKTLTLLAGGCGSLALLSLLLIQVIIRLWRKGALLLMSFSIPAVGNGILH